MATPADVTKALARARRHLSAADPKLAALMRRTGPCRLRPTSHYFPTLLQSIVGQQLSGLAADAIWAKLCARFPGGRYPRAEAILAASDELLRGAGLSRAKVLSIKDLSAHVLDGRLDLRHLSRQPDAHVIESLIAVRGIGEWTAHMFLMFSLFRLDVLPTGDLGIRKGCQKLYGLDHLPVPKEVAALAEEKGWAPHRSVASWYLWRILEE
jgi:3-methyladenine DNA glycosylase/8-oxoguanine DNA glycosylase